MTRNVADELRKWIVEPAEAILAALARIEEMKLSPAVRAHVDDDFSELAKDLRRRLSRESDALRRLRQTVGAFERRIVEMDKEHGR
jgi:methyl-accepting chemotaxis protein